MNNQTGRAKISRRTARITGLSWLGRTGAPGVAEFRSVALAKCPASVVDKSWAVSFSISTAQTISLSRATIVVVPTRRGFAGYAYRLGL
jgi:hypothetical protein